MIKMDPKVSIVIVHYKNRKVLFECLDSVNKSRTKASYEIIVVDNDEKQVLDKKLLRKYLRAKYIKSPRNVGYGAGNNLGISKAKGKYVLVLNPDTKVFPKTIDKLVSFLKKNKEAAMVAPNFYHKSFRPFKLQGSRELTPLGAIFSLSFIGKLFPNNPVAQKYFLKDKDFTKTREVGGVPGSCFLIQKSIFEKVGGFDENFFLFFEESDLCKRVKELGHKIYMIPSSKVIHLHKKSTPKTPKIKMIFRKSRFYYFRKHFGLLPAFVVEVFLRFNVYLGILFLFNLIFFSDAIFNSLYISSADITQRFPSFNLEGFHYVKNSLLFDPVTQFLPWYKQLAEVYKSFSLPLWNSLNAGGVPFLANTISSPFFPLTILYLIFSFKTAILLSYFLKLFLIGLFTFYYLKELGLKNVPSLIGATAFNFAGYNIVWLQWPHSNSIMLLPVLFLLIEKLIKDVGKRKLHLLLSISFLLLFLSGHPESMLHIVLSTGAYFLIRVFQQIKGKQERIKVVKAFVISLIFGVLLASFQLFPFIEYLFNSSALVDRGISISERFVPLSGAIFNVLPNILGNPSEPFYRPIDPTTNYNELVGGYIGTLPFIVSIFGLIFLFRKSKAIKAHFVLIIASFVLVYKIPIIHKLVFPLSIYSNNTRLLFLVSFGLSVCLAFFFEHKIYRRSVKYLKTLLVLSIFGLVVSAVFLKYFSGILPLNINPLKLQAFVDYEIRYMLFITTTSVLGFLSIILLSKTNYKKYRSSLLVLISIIVFVQTGYLNRKYNSTIEDKYFYPNTEEIEILKNLPQGKTFELGGNHIMPPDINMWYGISSIQNYDALDIRQYKTLYDTLFDQKTSWGTVLTADKRYLDLFGAKYILSSTEIDKKEVLTQVISDKLAGEILPGNEVSLLFKTEQNNLQAVRLLTANYNRLNACNFTFRLIDEKSLSELFNQTFDCNEIFDKSFFEIRFPAISGSKEKTYIIEISSNDAKTGNAISLWTDDDGKMVFTTIYDESVLSDVELIHKGKFYIYENKTAFPEYYFVSSAISFGGSDQILNAIKDSRYNLREVVLLEDKRGGYVLNDAQDNIVEVTKLESNANSSRISVRSENPGFLVTTNSYYPGWKVYVDGKKSKLLKANYAFSAVYLTKGEHEVVYKYIPESFLVGVVVSIISAFILLYYYKTHEETENS